MISWNEYLTSWERESRSILSLVPQESAKVPAIVEARGARHFSPPASRELVEAVETKLNVAMPEDMKSFYTVTNGWRLVGMGDMVLAPVEEIILAMSAPEGFAKDVSEYFGFENDGFVSPKFRDRALLVSNAAKTGFCVANPYGLKGWEFAFAEFGGAPERFDDFHSFLESIKSLCHYYLRSYLDFL